MPDDPAVWIASNPIKVASEAPAINPTIDGAQLRLSHVRQVFDH